MPDQTKPPEIRNAIEQPEPSRWRTTRCDGCGDQIEVDQFGWKTVCSCLASY
ncbi:hypothetical protein [Streptomyces griseofuscus]|uniref:Uncharacterized protein n=1 Tax=Streptomyces griseofuscus TaxID=146922 RepID=A0A7H1Q3L3_9ACTN|nr:hypothetical protein [Streptomyces griseofuscus]QNT94893.1 hypothetical protein HEP81_04620 [Streptomyces griseofuscus]